MKKMTIIAAFILAAATFAAAQKLETGKTFEREISGSEKHTYDVQLKKDEAYNLVVEQRGADVVLRVFAPDGTLVADLDSPTGTKGDEAMVFVAPETGNYRVEISPFKAGADKGKYFVKTVAMRPATREELAEARLKNELMNLNRQAFAAVASSDKSFFEQNLAADYIETSPRGTVLNKTRAIEDLPTPEQTKAIKVTPTFSSAQVRDFGDTALLSFLLEEEFQIGEQKEAFKHRVTQVYRRNDGKWQLAAQHMTEIKPPPADPPIVRMDAKALNDYVGQYSPAPGLILTIESDGEKLVAHYSGADEKIPMYPMGSDTFFNKGEDHRLIFVRDSSGKVVEVINRAGGRDIKAKKIK